jgi:hypothetical protein
MSVPPPIFNDTDYSRGFLAGALVALTAIMLVAAIVATVSILH